MESAELTLIAPLLTRQAGTAVLSPLAKS